MHSLVVILNYADASLRPVESNHRAGVGNIKVFKPNQGARIPAGWSLALFYFQLIPQHLQKGMNQKRTVRVTGDTRQLNGQK
ncbi:hypothetical protein OIU74_026986 [Salix koriyanagi]|uniref:Uncharacterized protein n=1 Tax=Salix koriyanagi TaxID=2511006 RepID=A0A9Q0W061_9ROSI|nr:hypothetical protein OIU74_026986 [Salix koriyanagi]